GGRVAAWGRVRPRGGTLVALQRRAPRAHRWTAVARLHGTTVQRRAPAGAQGTVWRVTWRDAAGATHASRTARATAP
ncbi:MAG TPA: hypothetical protein VNT55_06455, partial [Baekduia sp.]|nr:hypothetical protein [Baekduia sp.]